MNMTTNELIYFIFFVAVFALIAVILIVLLVSLVKGKRKPFEEEDNKKQPVINIYVDKEGRVVQGAQASAQPIIVQAAAPAPAPKEVVREVIKTVEKPAPAPVQVAPVKEAPAQDGTFIKASDKLDFAAELKTKDDATKKRFEQLIKYLKALDAKVRIGEAKSHVLAKYLSYRVCNIKFSKGYLTASFFVSSSEFKNYTKENDKVVIKEKPTVVILNSAESLNACFHLADIVYAQAKEAKVNKNK